MVLVGGKPGPHFGAVEILNPVLDEAEMAYRDVFVAPVLGYLGAQPLSAGGEEFDLCALFPGTLKAAARGEVRCPFPAGILVEQLLPDPLLGGVDTDAEMQGFRDSRLTGC